MTMLKCPNCGYDHDISSRISGDRILCVFCDKWLMLAFHGDGTAYFVIVQAPVSYPREKK